MKKKTFTLPFKSNFFKEQDPFHLVIVFFIVFFGTAIFFSVPTFYDYKKYNQEIEKTLNKEYKINFSNLQNISYRFIPSPHLLIKKAELKIKDNENELVSDLKNIKVFISITDLYKDNFKISRVEINKANFYLNNLSFKNLIKNLKKNIVNNLIIRKSTLFFKDEKKDVILISKIKNFNYKIDFVNNKKILKINGNIFDSNFDFKYLINYENPNIQNVYLELKNPNIVFENTLIDNLDSSTFIQDGILDIQFLNQKNEIKYKIIGSKIMFSNLNTKNSNFDLNGKINFLPFDFDLLIDLKKIKLTEVENILYLIDKNKNLILENISGKMKINFKNIENKAIDNGFIVLKFLNSKIGISELIFNLNDFAKLEVRDYEYLEDSNQILQMKVKTNIKNKEKFNRFLFSYKKDKIKKENIYFTYQFNADTKNSFISPITSKGFVNTSEFYKFKNLQQLKNLSKDDNIFKLD